MSLRLRRAGTFVLIGLVVATTCVLLGRWQWHKHVVTSVRIAAIEHNGAATPVPIDQLIAPGQAFDPSLVYRRVTVTGRYVADATVLLRGRTVDGTAAYHVLVPLRPDGSSAVLIVDRGWVLVPTDPTVAPDPGTPTSGEVNVTVRLRAAEPAVDQAVPAGQVRSTDVGSVLRAGALDSAAYTAIGELVGEQPTGQDAPTMLPAPDVDPGPYLSYACQWWAFAAMAIGGFGMAARREWLDPLTGASRPPRRPGPAAQRPRAPAGQGLPVPTLVRVPPRRRAEGRDEADEDAEIDAQLGVDAEPGRGATSVPTHRGADVDGGDRNGRDAPEVAQASVTRSR